MMANDFVIEISGNEFLIKKTRQTIIKEMVLFTIFFLAISVLISLFYLYISIRVNPLHVLLLSMLLLFVYNLYYRNKLKGAKVRIVKNGNDYQIQEFAFDAAAKKGLVLYERAGDEYSYEAGDLYLKAKTNEYLLYGGVTEEEMLAIKTKLEVYFSESLPVELKIIP